MQASIGLFIVFLCWVQNGIAQQQGDLRLINGSATLSGRLEIYDSLANEWVTICIDGFTMDSANTACKQLGKARAVSFDRSELLGYGMGTGSIGLTQVQCGEDDNHILRCNVMGIGTITDTTCDHTEDVAISCSIEPAFQYEGGVRLVGGQYQSEGLLEVFILNSWFTLCTESLSVAAATAICTQLGYTDSGGYARRSQSNNPSVWRTSPHCNFTTSCFSRCYIRPSRNNSIVNTCPLNTYIHVTCEFNSELIRRNQAGKTTVCNLGPAFETTVRNGDLRLQGGDNKIYGRLEVYDGGSGEWGTICIDGFTAESANTACRQLGYERATRFGEADVLGYGQGSGLILLTNVQCDGIVNHILRCSTVTYNSFVGSCNHGKDVGIMCDNGPALQYEGSVRLVNGPYQSEGRLEVFISHQWFSPCTTEFNDDAATAVCQQLGYTSSVGHNIISQVDDVTPWEISNLTCNSLSSCFSSCYVRPASLSELNRMLSCPSFTYIYVRCDFDPSISDSVPFGDGLCNLGPFPTEPPEPTEPPPTPPGTIIGIVIGVTAGVIIVLLFIMHKNGKLKELKQRWDRFVANTRRRITSWNPRNRVRHRSTRSANTSGHVTTNSAAVTPPAASNTSNAASNRSNGVSTSNAASTSNTNANRTHDSNKPPDYEEALAYRKSGMPENDGYPEPSLVNGPQPPSYDAVY